MKLKSVGAIILSGAIAVSLALPYPITQAMAAELSNQKMRGGEAKYVREADGMDTRAVEDERISQSELSASADSYQTGNEAAKAIDGNEGTWWHTSWSNRQDLPQSITLTLKQAVDGLYQLRYKPRNDKDWNGTIQKFEISVSRDGTKFVNVAEGVWDATRGEKSASFDVQNGVIAVRLTAFTTKGNSAGEDSQYASAAELNLVRNPGFVKDTEKLSQAVRKAKSFIEQNPSLNLQSIDAILEEAGVALAQGSLATQEMLDSLAVKLDAEVEVRKPKTSITGSAGERMYDTDGALIQAHGGQITKWGDTYYWYGEDKTDQYKPTGVHLYTSQDLYNWEDQGLVLKTMTSKDQFKEDAYFNVLYGSLSPAEQDEIYTHIDKNTAVVERPKVIYNEINENYVMWYHADGPLNGQGGAQSYGKAMAAVAVSDKPEGPFKLIKASRLNTSGDYKGESRGMARDMNLFVDADGAGYILYASEENATMYISRLNEDYTDIAARDEEAVEGRDFTRNMVGESREAPAIFRYKDRYYLMTSGCTGWKPNQARYYIADSPMGPWTSMGDPCVEDVNKNTFQTQSTCIFPVDAAKGKFIYMGDRWLTPDMGGELGDSRYVWLPVEFGENYLMTLREYSNWTLDELEGKSGFEVDRMNLTDMEILVSDRVNMDELEGKTVMVISGDGTTLKTPICDWRKENLLDSYAIGKEKLTGIMKDFLRKEISVNVTKYQDAMVYFVDCNGVAADYYDGFKRLGIELLNNKPDQMYDGEWGLVSKLSEDVGTHSGADLFGTGYWAEKDKSITYRFALPAGTYTAYAGFSEWWTASRQAQLNAKLVEEGGKLTQLSQATAMNTNSWDKQSIFENTFELKEDGVVQVSVDKVSGGDPLLAWLGITQKADTEALSETIESIHGEMSGMNAEEYSEQLWTELKQELADAEKALSLEGISQKKCDALQAKLMSALQKLKDSQKEPLPDPKPSPKPDPEPAPKPDPAPLPKEEYKIQYVLKKGKNNPANPSTYMDGTVELKSPSRRGYTFKGWYTDEKCKRKITSVSQKSVTVYAKWSKMKVPKTAAPILKSGSKKLTVRIKKVSGCKGYEIRCALDRKLKKGGKTRLAGKQSVVIRGLKPGRIYYVKVRAYKIDSAGKKVYGKYSAVKRIKVK